eukprot:296344_1
MEQEIISLPSYKRDSYGGDSENSEEKHELTDYSHYRKGYLNVNNKRESITDSGDTPITPFNSKIDSDDTKTMTTNTNTNIINDDIDSHSDTEFMDDDEHREKMMKLYRPKNKTKNNKNNNNLNVFGDAKQKSPEMSMRSITEPPPFNAEDNNTNFR